MKVTGIPKVIRACGIISEGLVKELEELEIRGRLETTALSKLTGKLRRALKI